MNKKWLLISILGLILLVAIVACSQSTPAPELESLTDEEVEELIVDKCSGCHPSSRVFDASYDAEGWSDVIDRMIDKGADVSGEEKELMVDWLANR